MKIRKIHGVEDYLFEQIQKFNGIGCFIKDFIEQAHQFKMLNKKAGKSRDRNNLAYIIFTNEWISINDDVNKIIEVRHNTRRNRKATTNIFVIQNQLKRMIEILYTNNVLKTHHYLRWILLNIFLKKR